MDAIHDCDISSMYILGENPAMSDPVVVHARAALAKLDHLVVQDIFLAETAYYADVILPASAWAEKIPTQAVGIPGEQKFFILARTVPPLWSATSEPTSDFAVALGYELRHARDIVYADHLDISKPKQLELISIERTHPPISHELRFDGHMRRVGLYDLDIN